jgi:1,4-alpha-glucan branching enzyme
VLEKEREKFPESAIRMRFLTNHDWHHTPNPGSHGGHFNGPLGKLEGDTIMLRYGEGVAAFMVLCATLPGKPLVYTGQEMGDGRHAPGSPVATREAARWDFYHRLLTLYQENPALPHGEFIKLKTDRDAQVYAFIRQDDGDQVLVVLNLSGEAHRFVVQTGPAAAGEWTELFSDQALDIRGTVSMELQAWEYRVYVLNQ